MGDISFTRDQIKEWNDNPKVVPSNVRLVPKEDADNIAEDKHKIKRKNITIFLLVLVVACMGVFTYLAFNGQLQLASCEPQLNISCSSVQCSAVTMPPITIPPCNCPSNNFTCNPTIKVCGNTTC